jgi:SOS-response transcriptional repressor LexA
VKKLHPETLAFIQAYTKQEGYPPSLAEIAAAIERSKSLAHERLHQLEAEGLITMRPGGGSGTSRTYRLTAAGMKALRYHI